MKAQFTPTHEPLVGNTILRLAFVGSSLLTCMFVIVKIFSTALHLIS